MVILKNVRKIANATRRINVTQEIHVKSIVKDLEGKGWSVIQIGFGGIGEDSMKDMFTNYMTVEDTNQLPLKLSKLMRKVMKL